MSDGIRRRDVLTGAALALVSGAAARAGVVKGELPWRPDAASPPPRVEPGPWQFFTAEELPAIEAIADRIIPPDPQTPGGKDAGCVVFLDRQLAGPYGAAEGLYDRAPFIQGVEQQGPQSSKTPAQTYRAALQALDQYCREGRGDGMPHGKRFAELAPQQQDEVLRGLEAGTVRLSGLDAKRLPRAPWPRRSGTRARR